MKLVPCEDCDQLRPKPSLQAREPTAAVPINDQQGPKPSDALWSSVDPDVQAPVGKQMPPNDFAPRPSAAMADGPPITAPQDQPP